MTEHDDALGQAVERVVTGSHPFLNISFRRDDDFVVAHNVPEGWEVADAEAHGLQLTGVAPDAGSLVRHMREQGWMCWSLMVSNGAQGSVFVTTDAATGQVDSSVSSPSYHLWHARIHNGELEQQLRRDMEWLEKAGASMRPVSLLDACSLLRAAQQQAGNEAADITVGVNMEMSGGLSLEAQNDLLRLRTASGHESDLVRLDAVDVMVLRAARDDAHKLDVAVDAFRQAAGLGGPTLGVLDVLAMTSDMMVNGSMSVENAVGDRVRIEMLHGAAEPLGHYDRTVLLNSMREVLARG